ncbi:MAG: Hydroxylamine reductase [Candidatus Anoxychlamydiales bacterium]|nr:Hydroxylamine reductase [Candidatus Anoxychlamydiales bacterium]NGX35480.1 Hydroxylamine reductase [Candidatus Anoxychlamydiales bacterium]
MFCYQCEQTKDAKACDKDVGICGKDATVADLQDVLIYLVKGISMYASRAAFLKASDEEIDLFVIEALFATVTNVDFDDKRFLILIKKGFEIRKKAKDLYESACIKQNKEKETLSGPAVFEVEIDEEKLLTFAKTISITKAFEKFGKDKEGLLDLILFGLKGAASYLDHAYLLGKKDQKLFSTFHEILDFLTKDEYDLNEILEKALKVGEINLKVMELLDLAHTSRFDHPTPTKVSILAKKGKAILVSGHDLNDLEDLLKQTKGLGINIYTHGEMLPAHGYPKLKKYPHLKGNYGGAWQLQRAEFNKFPGPIVMTTNCVIEPLDSYKDRLFTKGLVGWPGVEHIEKNDYSKVIEKALKEKGFQKDEDEKYITVGFGHKTVLGLSDVLLDKIKSGKIKHIFLIGGCDGAKPGRNYYTDFAKNVPKDCIIMTLACGKYRFNKLDFGDIDGIPRLLDVGQCNDAYSAIKIALALAEACKCSVNDLPLSFVLSWFEQKAVAILLTLLYLNIKNIRLGPTLPAFITGDVFKVLQDKFNIMPVKKAKEDINSILKN